MLSAPDSDRTSIARLRVESHGLDPLTVQLRAARLVQVCDLQPRGLPPSATLCIRRLRDPLPGKLSLHHNLSIIPRPEWQRALSDALDELTRSAVRPVSGQVPLSAQAVVFMDRAELLACFALDWLSGSVTQHWWWRTLLRDGGAVHTEARVLSAWFDAPEAMPAAFQILATRGASNNFVSHLSTETAQRWVQRIAHVFGMPALLQVIAASAEVPSSAAAQTQAPPAAIDEGGAPETLRSHTRHEPPWAELLAPRFSAGAASSLMHELLVGFALTLAEAPAFARSDAFVQQTRAWLDGEQKESAVESAMKAAQASQAQIPTLHFTPTQNSQIVSFQEASAPTGTRADGSDAEDTASRIREPSPARDDGVLEFAGSLPQDVVPSTDEFVSTAVTLRELEVVESEFGGLFYLVNAALALELYPDFTTPLARGLDVNFWEFLARVGDHYLGTAWHEDELWSLLQRFAGQTHKEREGLLCAPISELDWLQDVLHPLNDYLRRALRQDDSNEIKDWVSLLFAHHARILISATQMDLFFALDTLPIEIRLSGLDRNPGWVPAAGYFIAFHFD